MGTSLEASHTLSRLIALATLAWALGKPVHTAHITGASRQSCPAGEAFCDEDDPGVVLMERPLGEFQNDEPPATGDGDSESTGSSDRSETSEDEPGPAALSHAREALAAAGHSHLGQHSVGSFAWTSSSQRHERQDLVLYATGGTLKCAKYSTLRERRWAEGCTTKLCSGVASMAGHRCYATLTTGNGTPHHCTGWALANYLTLEHVVEWESAMWAGPNTGISTPHVGVGQAMSMCLPLLYLAGLGERFKHLGTGHRTASCGRPATKKIAAGV